MRLIQINVKIHNTFLFKSQSHSRKHVARCEKTELTLFIRHQQEFKSNDEMINEDRFTRAILVNDRMSRVISINQTSKTNVYKVNKKITIFRRKVDYTSSKR